MHGQGTPTFVFEVLRSERLVVGCRGAWEVTDTEWESYIDAVRELHSKGSSHRSLVYTDQPMTRRQQEQLARATEGNQGQVAVLSDSIAVRFIVSMFNLLNRNVRLFSPSQLSEALEHLNCTHEEGHAVATAYQRLRDQLHAPRVVPPTTSG
jgi:hypothetical protein